MLGIYVFPRDKSTVYPVGKHVEIERMSKPTRKKKRGKNENEGNLYKETSSQTSRRLALLLRYNNKYSTGSPKMTVSTLLPTLTVNAVNRSKSPLLPQTRVN